MKKVKSNYTDISSHPGIAKLAPSRTQLASRKKTLSLFKLTQLKRTAWRKLTLTRLLIGGRLSDGGRLWRYAFIILAGASLSWGPAIAYMKYGKIKYTSHFSLILPGSGASSSINLSDIGQASSAASSAFSGSSISPTVTYKNLLMSANVVHAAAKALNIDNKNFSAPTIKLVDETSFINVEMIGDTPEDARNRANAIQDAFFAEVGKLREDEMKRRDAAVIGPVEEYKQKVDAIKNKISVLQIRHGLNSADQFNALVNATDALQIKIAEAEAQLAKATQSKSGLASSLNLDDRTAAITMKLHADPEFSALADATAKAEAEYASTNREFGANHPKVVESRARFAGAKSQMLARATKITGLSAKKLVAKIDFSPVGQRSALLTQLIALSTDERGQMAQLDSMKGELELNRRRIGSLVGIAAELDRLSSEHKVAEAVFASALARISTSKTDIFASYPMAQVSEAAMIPLERSSPDKKIAIGAAAGSTFLLIFGLMLAWVRRPLIEKLLHIANGPDDKKKPA